MTTPIIRTNDRAAVIEFLEYLLKGFRAGNISGYESRFEPNGIGRHCVSTNDPSAVPFDLSDVEEDTPATAPAKAP